ncbi:type 1 glutamine amidotransferase domain-containing protein [Stappia sp.]|uniref:type 1 glutamine amidotransferase domain-containing protein n=1 Tax=Stappia sp. TaxID=1870903 RepID=UPI003A9A5DF0
MRHSPRILMIATSASTMGSSDEPTGIWLEELTTPYYAFQDGGAHVLLASIAGGPVPIDPRSVKPAGENDASVERYLADDDFRAKVSQTPAFDALDPNDFDAVFLPGGHGTMFDYPQNAALAGIVETMDRAGKFIAAVCHGPAGLVGARKADGTPFVADRRVAAFTDSEERAVGLDKAVPFLLESRLRELGARHESAPDFQPFAIRDGNLVTGQNPASAGITADLLMTTLKEGKTA